jgi:hypothetical protein
MQAIGRYTYHKQCVAACDAELSIAEDGAGLFFFTIKSSCLLLSLESSAQIRSIKNDSRFSTSLCEIPIPTETRGLHMTKCLPRREFAWWLAMIDPGQCKPEAREKLAQRQRALMDLADQVMFSVATTQSDGKASTVSSPLSGE